MRRSPFLLALAFLIPLNAQAIPPFKMVFHGCVAVQDCRDDLIDSGTLAMREDKVIGPDDVLVNVPENGKKIVYVQHKDGTRTVLNADLITYVMPTGPIP